MSGLHLVKQGRDRRRIDLQRDFTVASPAEFVTRFGGNKVIEKVIFVFIQHNYSRNAESATGRINHATFRNESQQYVQPL